MDDDTVDLSILRKVLLCAVLIVVSSTRALSWKPVCVRVCVCASIPGLLKPFT